MTEESDLKWLREKGVFSNPIVAINLPERDYQLFLKKSFREEVGPARNQKKALMEEVLEKRVKPPLLGKNDDQLYLVKLGKERIDYEQENSVTRQRKNTRRGINAKQYADNLVLAMGHPQSVLIKITLALETPTQEEHASGKKFFGVNRAQRAISRQKYQKESWKKTNVASQDTIEREQKQTWLLNSYFRELPEEKARFSRLLL